MAEQEIIGPGETLMIDASSIGNLTKAEIDQQIATAHRFPRSLAKFEQESKALVCSTEEIADECIYGVKRGGEVIVGPSIRFAEIMSYCYGNSRQATRLVNEGKEFITAQGVFHDLERNVAILGEVQRRIVDSKGKRYGIDLIGVTGNAAASIALRNAILRTIPKALWMPAYLAAHSVIAGGVRDLSSRRESAMIFLEKMGVHPDRVFAALDIRDEKGIDQSKLITLKALIQSAKDQDASLDSLFPRLDDDSKAKPVGQTPNGKPKADLSREAKSAGKPAEADQPAKGGKAPAEDAKPADAKPAAKERRFAIPAIAEGMQGAGLEFLHELAELLGAATSPNEVEAIADRLSLEHQPDDVRSIAEKWLTIARGGAGNAAAAKL